jgi:hypothetical protein
VVPVADLAEIKRRFSEFATTSRSRAPLYADLSSRIAGNDAIARLMLVAEPAQQVPVMLFAAVHMVLAGADADPLARNYATLGGRTPRTGTEVDRAWSQFSRFCDGHRDDLEDLIGTRQVQTNEVGRTSPLRAGLALLGDDMPLRLVDLGTAAGLNLGIDRYRSIYQPGGTAGPPSTVSVRCATRGPHRHPDHLATIVERVGIDSAPLDITDPTDRRWLQACIWADEPERYRRLTHAVEIVSTLSTEVERADLRDDPETLLNRLSLTARGVLPVMITSWTLNYLTNDEQRNVISSLERIGADRDLAWVALESPAEVTPLAEIAPAIESDDRLTALVLSRWRDGVRSSQLLARCHPHGHWLHWCA